MAAPKPYQIEDADRLVARLASHRAGWLWHDMGTGKSLIMILVAERLKAVQTLVLCPGIARENWRREIQKWQTRKLPVFVVGIDGPVPPPHFHGWIVVNYERLQDRNVDLLASLRTTAWDLAIVDEHHYLSNPEAQRTGILYQVQPDVRRLAECFAKVILASGTPMRNSPLDLWPHLFIWEGPAIFMDGRRMSRDDFRDNYCVVAPRTLSNGAVIEVVQGGRNEHDLLHRLKGVYLRRSRLDVIRDLPELHVFAHFMPTYGLAKDNLDQITPAGDDEAVADALEANGDDYKVFARLEFAALQRVSGVVELASELCGSDALFGDSHRKVILLAHHRSVMDELVEGLGNAGLAPMTIRGDQTPEQRQRAIDAFQTNERVRTIVVQLQVGSTAVNLTAATDVLFVELDWTAANNSQCIARAWRMGQGQPVDARLCLGTTRMERGQSRIVARRLASIQKIAPDFINRALIDALSGPEPELPAPQTGANDDWLDGPAAPSPAPRPADADAAWLE